MQNTKIKQNSETENANLASINLAKSSRYLGLDEDASQDVGRACTITRYPDEDLSERLSKCETQSSKNDPKLLTTGFRLTCLAKKIKEMSFSKGSKSFQVHSVRPYGNKPGLSKSFDNASIRMYRPRSHLTNEIGVCQKKNKYISVKRRSIEKEAGSRTGMM